MKTKSILTLCLLLAFAACKKDDVVIEPFCEGVFNEPYYLIEQGDTTTLQPETSFEQVFNKSYSIRFGEGTTQQTFGWNDILGREFEEGDFVKVQWQSTEERILIRIITDRFEGIPFYEIDQCEEVFVNVNIDYLINRYEVRIKLNGSSAALFPFSFEHEKQDSKEIPIKLEVPAQREIQVYKEII